MSTLDLVHAIINKDAVGIESNFNDVMAEKISTKLEDMRTNVAQSMFASQEAVVEEGWDPEKFGSDGSGAGGAGAGDVSNKDKKKKKKEVC